MSYIFPMSYISILPILLSKRKLLGWVLTGIVINILFHTPEIHLV